MTIYFTVPRDFKIISRLVEVLKLSNNYVYDASKSLITVNDVNITSERLRQLAKSLRTSTEVNLTDTIKVGSLHVESALIAKYNKAKLKRTVINYETQEITAFGLIDTPSIDNTIADIINNHNIDNFKKEDIPEPYKELAKAVGITEQEIIDSANALSEMLEEAGIFFK